MPGLRVPTLYKDIFAAIYGFALKRWDGDEVTASEVTTTALAGALLTHGVTIVIIATNIYGPGTIDVQWWVFGLLIVITFSAYYTMFLRHRRFRTFVRDFEGKPADAKRRITVIAWIYVIGSVLMPVSFAFAALVAAP